jgi:hypothetical protein
MEIVIGEWREIGEKDKYSAIERLIKSSLPAAPLLLFALDT